MRIQLTPPKKALHPAYRKEKVSRKEIDSLKAALPRLLDLCADPQLSESTLRDHLQSFLRAYLYPSTDFLLQSELRRMDTVIHDGPKTKDPIGVIIEAKTPRNVAEMFSPERPHAKAMLELLLYFMRERAAGNIAIKQLVITNGDDFYLFADREFERIGWEKKRFRNALLAADADKGKNNELVYELIGNHLESLGEETLTATHFRLSNYRVYCEDNDLETDKHLLPLHKILSPAHLLRRPFANDSNKLDKGFYRELLHLIGLEEVGVDSKGKEKKNGGKKIIRRATGANRHPASLLENALQVAAKEDRYRHVLKASAYGNTTEERHFAIALELCLTWVNRILFLKLLESQLVSYYGPEQGRDFRFLTPELVPDYDGLNTLFFDVLAKPVFERDEFVSDFANVPYLNSSLFEITDLEDQVIRVNSLKDQFELPLAANSVLKDGPKTRKPLHYLFAFLDAYDFGSEGGAAIQEDNKRLINASVLGLIFEKINGYRDGSFYTPGFITEYMCRETIRRAVVQKFVSDEGTFAAFQGENFDELINFLRLNGYQEKNRKAAAKLVNSTTICDPAVGSGHFLVSALNELIAVKSELGLLGADRSNRVPNLTATVANDELVFTDRYGEPFEYRVSRDSNQQIKVAPEVQLAQEIIFHEKRSLIEGCLFGVDLNPNSVKICRLRLWIELLKNAYYSPDTGQLETLPNIDINIKRGNSLVSRFALDDDLKGALADSKFSLDSYRIAVATYHRATGQEEKRALLRLIHTIKDNFETHIGRNDKRVKDLARIRGKEQQLRSLLETGDLFGQIDTHKVQAELDKVSKQLDFKVAELDEVKSNAIYEDAFEWRFEFPAVLDEDGTFVGFDVVVGNPPYVSISNFPNFKTHAKKNYKTFSGKSDLYALFVEKGFDILKKDGELNYIISNGWLRAKFGEPLRKFIVENKCTVRLVNFEDDQLFAEATVETCILSLSSEFGSNLANTLSVQNADDFKESPELEFRENSVEIEISSSPWFLANKMTLELKKKLEDNSINLGDLDIKITYGIRTGFNEAFIIGKEKYIELGKDSKNSELLGPILRGRDIKKYTINFAEQYVILSAHKQSNSLEHYPEIKKWLSSFRTQLSERGQVKNGQHHWLELDNGPTKEYFEAFQKPKIVWAEISDSPQFTYDETGFYTNNKIYILTGNENLKAILAILNSKISDWYFNLISTTSGAGTSFWLRYKVESMPIILNPEFNDLLTPLVTQILALKSADPAADTSALEAEIDVLVYRLYGLTYAEVLVVDPGFGLDEAGYAAVEVK